MAATAIRPVKGADTVRLAARVGVLLMLCITGGCGGDSRDPNRELTVDERAELLRDVRADKSRLQNLTPAERAYLVKRMGK